METPEGKVCTRCGEWKPLGAFYKHPAGKFGRHSWCSVCANARQRETRIKKPTPEQRSRWSLMTRYGITPEQHVEILASQGGRCAICREVPERPCVDHNHDTGKVRGILCHFCNIRLPAVEDDAYRLPALAYLAAHANDNLTLEHAA